MITCSRCGSLMSYAGSWAASAPPICDTCRGRATSAPALTFAYGYAPPAPAISLRDWFAGMALMGLNAHGWTDVDKNAMGAWKAADAMLKAREGGEG